MFAKLLKYEWKATYKLLGILSLCALGGGVLAAGLIRAIDFFNGKMVSNSGAVFAVVICGFMLFGLIMAAVVFVIGSQFWLYYRFYKTKFTDEGYLSFTLPAKPWKIFLAAMTNIYAWILIEGLAVGAAVLIAQVFGAQMDIQEIWLDFFGSDGLDWEAVVLMLPSIISSVTSVVLVMASITAGAVAAKKHKILAAIGIYYGQSLAQGIVSSIISVFIMFLMFADGSAGAFGILYCLLALVPLLWGVGAYCLSVNLLNKKLNLP